MKSETHENMPPTELPEPEAQAVPLPEKTSDSTAASELTGVTATEIAHTTASSSPFYAQPTSLPQTQSQQPPPVTAQTATPMPVIADDDDLIEKEWVQKAKAIVAQTRQDPYIQNKEMNKYKADYVKKRFNKDVKVSES